MPRRVGVAVQVRELSPSEYRLCDALASGSTYKEAAHEFGVSENTARTWGKRAMDKLGLSSTDAIIGSWDHLMAFARWQGASVVRGSTSFED